MPNNKKALEVTLVHEYWNCKREFYAFINYSTYNIIKNASEKEIKILAFTAYGNFLRHLFSFHEGIIEYKDIPLPPKDKKRERAEEIKKILQNEAEKLRQREVRLYVENPDLDEREIQNLKAEPVPKDFIKYFKHFRNKFSHLDSERVDKKEISLNDFYQIYHKYILLLFKASSTWEIESIENYDWLDIENFFSVVSQKASK